MPRLLTYISIEADVPSDDEIIEIVSSEVQQPEINKSPRNLGLGNGTCEGYTMQLPGGQSPHGMYPFTLHDLHSLPWNYAVFNGILILFACGCRGLQAGFMGTCKSCRDLGKDKVLEGIKIRMESGIAENTTFAYHSINGLIQLLNRKNERIEFHRLHGLNPRRSLL